MLDDLWARLVTTPEEQQVLYSLTEYLVSKEELWAPKVKFEDYQDVLQSLETKGILQTQGLRIGFRHQTLLEHAKARLFTKDDKSLTKHVLKLQGQFMYDRRCGLSCNTCATQASQNTDKRLKSYLLRIFVCTCVTFS